MNFNEINTEIKNEELTLKPISSNDREFINNLFQDRDISNYYIVPKEARQDYRKLIDYWLNDNANGAGTCWIIHYKKKGLFSNNKPCGFIAFEFRDNLQNAKISYAILPEYRKKGIATKSCKMVIERLKDNGVITVEADIDKDNLRSEKVVENLFFTTDKGSVLIDPEMLRDGEIRVRNLWKKFLVETTTLTSIKEIPSETNIEQITPVLNKLINEINSKGQHPHLMLQYFYLVGRIKYIEGNFEEARSLFGECNMMIRNNEFPDTHLYFYWLGKINKKENKTELARSCFEQALEKYNSSSLDVSKSEIKEALKNL